MAYNTKQAQQGYINAVKKYKAPPAVIKAIAPTKAAKVALGPRFGSPLGSGMQPIPQWQMPATPNVTQTTPPGLGGGTRAVPRSAAPMNYIASLADITGHPLGEQARGAYNTNMQSFMRALRSGLGQKIVSAGYDPTAAFQKLMADRPDLGEFGDLLDPTAIAAAGANPLSGRAQTEQKYQNDMADVDYQLAARGIEGSGAQATGGNRALQTRQLGENQIRDDLLQAIQGGMSDYLGQKTQGYDSLQGTYAKIAEMLAQQQGATYDEGGGEEEEYSAADEEAVSNQTVPGTNVPSAANTNYVMWGGTPMKNVTQMKQWLAQRGQNWNTWANRYPDAARKLLYLS